MEWHRWLPAIGRAGLVVGAVRYLLGLAVRLVVTVAVAVLGVFTMIEISIDGGFRTVLFPGGFDPASTRQQAIAEHFHLDEPIVVRFGHWVADVARGDLGTTVRGAPIVELIQPRLPISLEFMIVGVLGAFLLGVPLGLAAAAWSDRWSGDLVNVVFGLSQSVPVFVTPMFLIWVFAVQLRWLPATGWVRISDSIGGNLWNLLLPGTALILSEVGIVGRVIRSDALQVLRSDHVAAARGKGLPRRYILFRHVLRPSSLGLANVAGLSIASLLSGTIVIEIVFGIGGLGQLIVEASVNRDLYLLSALTVYVVVVYVVLNTIVDLVMYAVDPRITRRRVNGAGSGAHP